MTVSCTIFTVPKKVFYVLKNLFNVFNIGTLFATDMIFGLEKCFKEKKIFIKKVWRPKSTSDVFIAFKCKLAWR
jgi:hypothetical protein